MEIFILIIGVGAGVMNILSANGAFKRLNPNAKKIERTNIGIGYIAAGWMLSWALFEGLFPLLGGK